MAQLKVIDSVYSNKVIVTHLSCIFHNVYNAYKSGSLLSVTKYSTSPEFPIVVWFVSMSHQILMT